MKKYDNTTLSCLQRCEQEYVWRHVRHLRATNLSASAHFGQMVHIGVKALYSGQSPDDACLTVRRAWEHSTAGIIVGNGLDGTGLWSCTVCGHYWDGKREAHGKLFPSGTTDAHKHAQQSGVASILPILNAKKQTMSAAHALSIVRTYHQTYFGTQPYECIWNEGYAESATESALPDRAVRSTVDGKVYAMDLKTTSMYMSAAWERSFEHSQQVAMQLDVLEATLGERVEGFVLDAVHIGRLSPTSPDFVRYGPLSYSDALRAELRQHRERLAVRADALQSAPTTALKAPSACVRYNDLCAYFDLCHADPEDREALVQIKRERQQLEELEWVPSERDA